jgi:hypothetical protein
VSRFSALQWTCVFLWLTPTMPLAAADQTRPLFPTPIHLTRTTSDPFLHRDLTVEQYADVIDNRRPGPGNSCHRLESLSYTGAYRQSVPVPIGDVPVAGGISVRTY